MGEILKYFLWTAIVMIGLVVPFIFCLVYIFIGIRQWSIGNKEHNALKQKGAIKIIFITLLCLVAILIVWWQLFINFFSPFV